MTAPIGQFNLKGKWAYNRSLCETQAEQRKYMRDAGHICKHNYIPHKCPQCAKEKNL